MRLRAAPDWGKGVAGFARCYTRGIPYTPQGTIQDFTSSPRHTKLAEMQRDIDLRAGRVPTRLYEGPTITTEAGARPLFSTEKERHATRRAEPYVPQFFVPGTTRENVMPMQSSTYQEDQRSDPSHAEEPEHVVAARQRIMTMQSDSYGESMRLLVPPPPPVDASTAPSEYHIPRVQLSDNWWILMWLFAILFLAMARYGK